MHEYGWVRWYMVAFFILFGAWLLIRRASFASARCVVPGAGLDERTTDRLQAAYCCRRRREALPSVAMASIIGGTSFAMAALGAFTRASVTLLYAALTVVMAGVLAGAFVRLRRSESRRVASLRARDPSTVAPWYAWSAVAVAVVLPLLWLERAPLGSLTVVCAGVTILVLARRVAAMPALLLGEDLAVERFVDERVRADRTTHLLAVAVAPGYVFEAFGGFTDSPAHVVALAFTLVALAAVTLLSTTSARRRPSPAQVAEWSFGAN
jgi:hypothetical protein